MKRILLLIALLGFGTGAYVLLRPAPTQVIRLEPVTALPNRLEQPAVTVVPKEKPVSSVKPRPTLQIDPSRRPVILAKPQTRNSTRESPSTNITRESPNTTQESPSTTTTQESPSTTTTRESPSTPPNQGSANNSQTPKVIPGIRQEAGSWRIQAGAFRTQSNAEALETKLQARGLSTKVSQGEDGIYRVLVGAYFSSAAAKADAPKISNLIP